MSIDFIDQHSFFRIIENELKLSENDLLKIKLFFESESKDNIEEIVEFIKTLINEKKINIVSQFFNKSELKKGLINRSANI